MYFHRLPARQWGLATVVGLAALAGQVQAQIQAPAPAPAQALDDGSTSTFLKLDGAGSRNYFVRFGYTYFKPNTTAGKVYDVTGPAVEYKQAQNLVAAGKLRGTNGALCTPSTGSNPYSWNGGTNCRTWGQTYAKVLDEGLSGDNQAGIGIPPILSSNAAGAGLFTIQAGVFFDDEHKWSAEPYIFGVPPENKVYATGENSLSGQLALTTQLLPITVVLNRYFGDKNAPVRASLGIGGTYAIFFNSQATNALNNYSGGETDVKIKNAFGYGPFAGLQFKLADRWHLNAQVGYVKLKTSASLTTHDTKLSNGTALSDVVKDIAAFANDPSFAYYSTAGGICTILCSGGEGTYAYNPNSANIPKLAAFLAAIQNAQGGSLGTYTRKQDVSLDPYVFSLSLGYEF